MQKSYELTLIFSSSATEGEQKKLIEDIEDVIKKSGKVGKSQCLGKKTLAYPIKKQKEGYYWMIECECVGKECIKLLEKLKMMEDVLRYLFVVKE